MLFNLGWISRSYLTLEHTCLILNLSNRNGYESGFIVKNLDLSIFENSSPDLLMNTFVVSE